MRSFETKAAIMLTLLIMILMRLVWMDLRSYTVTSSAETRKLSSEICSRHSPPVLTKASQGTERPNWLDSTLFRTMLSWSCRGGSFSEFSFIRYNQGLMLITVLSCMLLIRLITRSWLLGLFLALALLSRGRLISSNGDIGGGHLIMAGIGLWTLSGAHWIRSRSRLLLGLHAVCACLLVSLEFSFITLPLALLLMLLLRKYLPGPSTLADVTGDGGLWLKFLRFMSLPGVPKPADELAEGGIFLPTEQALDEQLDNPSLRRRLLKDWGWLMLLVLIFTLGHLLLRTSWNGMSPSLSWAAQRAWIKLWLLPVDRDLGASLLMLLACLLPSAYGLPGLRGLTLLVIFGFLLSAGGVWVQDCFFRLGHRLSGDIWLWWEPIFLSFGVLGTYHVALRLALAVRSRMALQ